MCVGEVLLCEEHINTNREGECREKERRKNPRFLDGFVPDLERFSRDRISSKLLGKLYKLFKDFKALKNRV